MLCADVFRRLQGWGQVVAVNNLVVAKQDGPFHTIFQFPDIARPMDNPLKSLGASFAFLTFYESINIGKIQNCRIIGKLFFAGNHFPGKGNQQLDIKDHFSYSCKFVMYLDVTKEISCVEDNPA